MTTSRHGRTVSAEWRCRYGKLEAPGDAERDIDRRSLAPLEHAKTKRHDVPRLNRRQHPPLDRISVILAESLEAWEADALAALAQSPRSVKTSALERLLDLRLAEPAATNCAQTGYRVSLLGQSVLAILRQSRSRPVQRP